MTQLVRLLRSLLPRPRKPNYISFRFIARRAMWNLVSKVVAYSFVFRSLLSVFWTKFFSRQSRSLMRNLCILTNAVFRSESIIFACSIEWTWRFGNKSIMIRKIVSCLCFKSKKLDSIPENGRIDLEWKLFPRSLNKRALKVSCNPV